MKKDKEDKGQQVVIQQSTTEKRSEVVSDIIERMPTGWTILLVIVITVIVMVMFTFGFVMKYSDIVSGQLTVTGEKAPVRLVAKISGRLHLLVSNNQMIKTGMCLGYIESGTVYKDFLLLDSICRCTVNVNSKLNLPENLELGNLSSYYNDFLMAYVQYDQIRNTKVYDNMRKKLKNQQQSDRCVLVNLRKEINLNRKVLSNLRNQFLTDSILYEKGALSHESFAQQENGIMTHMQSDIELKNSELVKLSDVNAIEIELAKIDVNVCEELTSSYNSLIAKFNILVNQVRLWKELYLLHAPIDGTLQYLGFWRNNVYVDASTEIFSVLPCRNRMIGEVLISSVGAGKVKVGQDVNVKLQDYPYNEYGYIRGKVASVSSLARNMKTLDGNIIKSYLVTVTFPEGVKTNFGKQLNINFESIGTADIITKKRRLIQRLFDNLQVTITK